MGESSPDAGGQRVDLADSSSVALPDRSADEEPIVIEADVTEYRYGSHGTIVEARGSVRATHREISVSADYLSVDVDAGELLARGNVLVRRGSSTTSCSEFAYDVASATGRVIEPRVSVPGAFVRGREMDLAPGEFALAGAHATGCDLEEPCYRVTSRRLVIYPDRRIVADWPVLWLERVPVLVVPRLSIPLRGERVGWVEGEGYPVPRLSYDPQSGFVAGMSYLDRSREGLTIRWDGAYASRARGIQLEARAQAGPAPGVSAEVTGGLRSWEGPYGSAMCRIDPFSQMSFAADARYRSGTAHDAGLQGGAQLTGKLGPLVLKAAARKDLPSTGPVYSFPAVDASLGPVTIPGSGARLTLSAGVGRFEEPARGARSSRTYAALSVTSRPLSLTFAKNADATLTLTGSARRAWYETGDSAGSLMAAVNLEGRFGSLEAFGIDVPRVVAGLEYTRRVVSGASPFTFDAVGALNQVTVELAVRLAPSWTVELGSSYDVDAGVLDDLDLSVTNHHHCYDIAATWREKRREFGLEVRFTR
jgi:hypothetical protein